MIHHKGGMHDCVDFIRGVHRAHIFVPHSQAHGGHRGECTTCIIFIIYSIWELQISKRYSVSIRAHVLVFFSAYSLFVQSWAECVCGDTSKGDLNDDDNDDFMEY